MTDLYPIDSGETLGNLVSRIAAPIQSQLPPPFDNDYSLCRFRCFTLGRELKPLVASMMSRHWPEMH